MYNTPIRFDGDIIITDPCYIMRKDSQPDYSTSPSWWDFVSRTTSEEITSNGRTFKRYNMPKPEDYPDCREKNRGDYGNDEASILRAALELCIHEKKPMFSPTLQAELDAYHEAEEKWQEENMSDWERCEYGDEMEVLGINTYLSNRTIYGDWSCTTFNSDTKEKIGAFCADAGMVAVFLLDEVLKYNPDFDYHTERPWTTTLIRDFHGTVELHRQGEDVTVVGNGNVNFIGKQTGF